MRYTNDSHKQLVLYSDNVAFEGCCKTCNAPFSQQTINELFSSAFFSSKFHKDDQTNNPFFRNSAHHY